MAARQVFRCKAPFAAFLGGAPRVVSAGALVFEGDPILKGNERRFEPVDDHVERMTARPGERRSVSIPDPEPESDDGTSGGVDVEEYHSGGGWYELPDGRKVRGEDAAREALEGDQQ